MSRRVVPVVALSILVLTSLPASAGDLHGLCLDASLEPARPASTEVAALGAGWVRTAAGAGQEADLEGVFRRYGAFAGVLVVLTPETLGELPPVTDDDTAWAGYVERFGAMVERYAERFGGRDIAFEIGNAPDLAGISPQRMAELHATAFARVREHTDAPVLLAALGGASWVAYLGELVGWLGGVGYDGIAFRAFALRADGWPRTDWGIGELRDILALATSIAGRPTWATELGLSLEAAGAPAQAEYVRRAFAIAAELGPTTVAHAFWFAWSDATPGGPAGERYGLVEPDGTHRAAWDAFATVTGSAGLPDAVVAELGWSPAAPVPGDALRFFARVRNEGAAGTGADVGVAFRVDGGVASFASRGPLASGETSDVLWSTGTWTVVAGTFRVEAHVDDAGRFVELDEENNRLERTLTVGGPCEECDDGSLCTTDRCDPRVGCVFETLACDDGDACTDDWCEPARGCVTGTRACDDGDPCTADGCDPLRGCTTEPLTCDDGSACTTDRCDRTRGCLTAEVRCDDRDACTVDGCDPATGCTFTALAGCCQRHSDCDAPRELCLPDRSLCVPTLCWPCTKDADCGATGNRCLALPSGDFCGVDARAGECPEGADVTRLDDGAVQCLPAGGDCHCVTHASRACRDGDVAWLTSCGVPEDRYQSCGGRGCVGDRCCPVGSHADGDACVADGGDPRADVTGGPDSADAGASEDADGGAPGDTGRDATGRPDLPWIAPRDVGVGPLPPAGAADAAGCAAGGASGASAPLLLGLAFLGLVARVLRRRS